MNSNNLISTGDSELMPAATPTLIASPMGAELLIYNPTTFEAHHLNETAAKVWKLCNGETTLAQASSELEGGEAVLHSALEMFQSKKLLSSPTAIVRRDFMTAAVKIGILMPLVYSVLAPAPAAAASGSCATACVTDVPGCEACGQPVVSPRSALNCTAKCGSASAPCPSTVVCMAGFTKGAGGSCATDFYYERLCRATFSSPNSGTDCASVRGRVGVGDVYYCCSNCT